MAPTLNALGAGQPVAFAVQVDSLPPSTNYFIPPAAPGELPDAWSGYDGFVVSFAISTRLCFRLSSNDDYLGE